MLNEEFDKMLNTNKLEAWKCFKRVCLKVLVSYKAENFEDLVANLLHSYNVFDCKMSLKVHFFESHIKIFHENLGDVSDDHGERFQQDIDIIEKRFKGKYSVGMLQDYFWSIKRDASELLHERRRR